MKLKKAEERGFVPKEKHPSICEGCSDLRVLEQGKKPIWWCRFWFQQPFGEQRTVTKQGVTLGKKKVNITTTFRSGVISCTRNREAGK